MNNDEELTYYRDRLLSIIEENLKTLVKRKAIGSYDLNRLSSYYLLMQKKTYEAGQHDIPVGLLNSVRFTFAITSSLVYALDLLKNYGLRSFYKHVKGTRTEESPKGGGKKGFNLGNILKKNTVLQEILDDLKKKFEPDGNVTFNGELECDTVHSVPGHPKLVKLQEIVLNHFATEGSDTKVMVFTQFRASVEEITSLLRQHSQLRPVQFVGQSSAKKRGFSQKQQLEVLSRFREGEYNILVTTCVAILPDLTSVMWILSFAMMQINHLFVWFNVWVGKKRNSAVKRSSSGGSTAKKRKNRFIFQTDEEIDENQEKEQEKDQIKDPVEDQEKAK
ncbi:uncharacterized protein LOC128390750 [Panonychus citri]|uniref:uncharacterized protein LOC128390750 n=1 Tax=Panonychus citri TaxID=50023 RepID=UPI00230829A2|nr:uncharacterized protein LOC128390750 [Panonychus citri]